MESPYYWTSNANGRIAKNIKIMNTENKITITTTVQRPIALVWDLWTKSNHIKRWNTASPDWHTTRVKNDLHVGGTFKYRMEAKDRSIGFDFEGTYTTLTRHKRIAFTLTDKRKIEVVFTTKENTTKITEHFEPENINSAETQQAGWQAILENFKKYAEKYEP